MNIGKPERETQDRVIALFRDELHYRCLGGWLIQNGYTTAQIKQSEDTIDMM